MARTEDTRVERRFPISAEVIVQIAATKAGELPLGFRGYAVNISLSGIKLGTYQLQPEEYNRRTLTGAPVQLDLDLPYLKEPLKLRGQVAWSILQRPAAPNQRPAVEFGIRFDHLEPNVEAKIRYVLDRVTNESYDSSVFQRPKLDDLRRTSGLVGIPLRKIDSPKKPG